MYLVIDDETGTYVFSQRDPRRDGFRGPVREDIEIETSGRAPRSWVPGEPFAQQYLGRSRQDQKRYHIFHSSRECDGAGYDPVGSRFCVVHNWEQFHVSRWAQASTDYFVVDDYPSSR